VQGTYGAMVYMTTLVGGWIADKLFGLRRSVFWGGVMIMCGHLSLALPRLETFYLGLALVALGTGLLKGNVSAIVGQLYTPEDRRRDAGFSLYYMGVNLGGFLGPIVTGFLVDERWFRDLIVRWGFRPEQAWHFGFGAAAFGMLLGLIQYTIGRRRLPATAEHPLGAGDSADQTKAKRTFTIGLGVAAGLVLLLVVLDRAGVIQVTPGGVATAVDWLLVVVTVGFFAWLFGAGRWTPDERKRLLAIVALFFGATVFWAGFEQAATTLNLFAQRSTANTIFGWHYPFNWLQSVNSLFIIIFAPVVGAVWLWLKHRNPSSPTKFTMSLLLLAAGYGLMIVAAIRAGSGAVSPLWLIGCYFFQTIGELCLSPVGLSAMSTLAPTRASGLMMGVWFLALALGNKIAGRIGGLYESLSLPMLFTINTLFVLVFAIVMALLIVPINRMLASTARTA
jgi:proton-dependent oligopeptide transporter, POT family